MTNRPKKKRSATTRSGSRSGKLRIGNSWNAITIIALSQNNPLKAIAEFVENSIDAKARNITIVRGKDHGELYLKVVDDGQGIPLNEEGEPDFKYVATHICDSAKRLLRKKGEQGLQGEFGIGLLSFWTVGERMILSSAARDGRAYQMEMRKGNSSYSIVQRRVLFSHPGTELIIRPLLSGIRQLNGERIQNYLALELRDRIRKTGVRITIKDRQARKELEVKPRQFSGRLLRDITIPSTPRGDVYAELYLNAPSQENMVGLFRSGTRVIESLTRLSGLDHEPWSSGCLQGMVDAPFLQLTPGTRDGVVHDDALTSLMEALATVESTIRDVIDEERRAEEEEASKNVLRSVRRALREAFLALPPEDYDWFDIQALPKSSGRGSQPSLQEVPDTSPADTKAEAMAAGAQSGDTSAAPEERQFFEFPGPLYGAVISPSSSVLGVAQERTLRCIPRDKSRRPVDENLRFRWELVEGKGFLTGTDGEIVTFIASSEPGLARVTVTVSQGPVECVAEAVLTITDELLSSSDKDDSDRTRGLPGYTYLRAPGELWRSRYDEKKNLIVINNGHRDYVFAARKPSRKLKYVCRLFSKELVLSNFPGFDAGALLERMVELSLYTEEHLK